MSITSEQWWEKKLNIRTSGKIDHFVSQACNPYEPTDYRVLQALAESGYVTADSHVLDYGSGTNWPTVPIIVRVSFNPEIPVLTCLIAIHGSHSLFPRGPFPRAGLGLFNSCFIRHD